MLSDPCLQIIGLDSEPIRNEKDEYLLLHRHYRKLRDHPIFKLSKHIFIPENCLGMNHHYLKSIANDIEGVQTFWETEKKPGIYKSDKVTSEYQFLMTNLLAEHGLLFDQDLFTTTREKTPVDMLNMLQDEMSRFHWSVKKPADEHGKERVKLTAKIGNLNDDLLIAVFMIPYVGRMIIRNPARLDVRGS